MAAPDVPTDITAGVTTGHVEDHEELHAIALVHDLASLPSTKGDLLVVSGGLIKRLPVGTDDQVLTADAAETAGVKWATPTGGGGGGGDFTLIEEITLGVDGTFTFDAIPVTSSDLRIVAHLRSDRPSGLGDNVRMRVGATTVDSGSNYAWDQDGSSAGSGHSDSAWTVGVAKSSVSADDIALPVTIDIPNYVDTTFARSFLSRASLLDFSAQASQWMMAGIWNNTVDAIDIIELFPENGTNFKTGSVARLYGFG